MLTFLKLYNSSYYNRLKTLQMFAFSVKTLQMFQFGSKSNEPYKCFILLKHFKSFNVQIYNKLSFM